MKRLRYLAGAFGKRMRKLAVPVVLLFAALGVAAAPSAAMAAPIRPATATTCADFTAVNVCFEIDGSGSYVNFMAVTASWHGKHTGTNLRIWYTPTQSPSWNGPKGTNEATFTKTLSHDENAGQWCGGAYQNGVYLGASCVNND
jgi:hypothetical protein